MFQKTYVNLGLVRNVNRGKAGKICIPVADVTYCCKEHLCNGNVPTSTVSSIVLGLALASVFAYHTFLLHH